MRMLRTEAQNLGMDVLVEAHTEAEVKAALSAGASLIGINNRDLATFEVTWIRPASSGPWYRQRRWWLRRAVSSRGTTWQWWQSGA